MKIVVLGANGHGQVVADILFQMWTKGREMELVGFLDDDPKLGGTRILGLPVLGKLADLPATPHDCVILGIGDNAARARVYGELVQARKRFATAIHPSAILAPDVVVGAGAVLAAGAIANPGARIGENAILNTGSSIDHHCVLGAHSHVAPGVHLAGRVTVGEGAFVGIGACAVQCVQIGAWSTVGAGAAVTQDVPERATVGGVPARAL
ncbi:MAG: acetyltransferase [Desulfovibrio sp.]|jgi:sugar O-acyltransferase (sialic acid O-acetyltransferase NeuD family)|nr:acetyltransferase [Desulfovibrio sp.]